MSSTNDDENENETATNSFARSGDRSPRSRRQGNNPTRVGMSQQWSSAAATNDAHAGDITIATDGTAKDSMTTGNSQLITAAAATIAASAPNPGLARRRPPLSPVRPRNSNAEVGHEAPIMAEDSHDVLNTDMGRDMDRDIEARAGIDAATAPFAAGVDATDDDSKQPAQPRNSDHRRQAMAIAAQDVDLLSQTLVRSARSRRAAAIHAYSRQMSGDDNRSHVTNDANTAVTIASIVKAQQKSAGGDGSNTRSSGDAQTLNSTPMSITMRSPVVRGTGPQGKSAQNRFDQISQLMAAEARPPANLSRVSTDGSIWRHANGKAITIRGSGSTRESGSTSVKGSQVDSTQESQRGSQRSSERSSEHSKYKTSLRSSAGDKDGTPQLNDESFTYPDKGSSSLHKPKFSQKRHPKDSSSKSLRVPDASLPLRSRQGNIRNFRNVRTGGNSSGEDDDGGKSEFVTATTITSSTSIGAFSVTPKVVGNANGDGTQETREISLRDSYQQEQLSTSQQQQPHPSNPTLVAELAPTPEEIRNAFREEIEEEFQKRVNQEVQQRMGVQVVVPGVDAYIADAIQVEPAGGDANDYESGRGGDGLKGYANEPRNAVKLLCCVMDRRMVIAVTTIVIAVAVALVVVSQGGGTTKTSQINPTPLPTPGPTPGPTALPSETPTVLVQPDDFHTMVDILAPLLSELPTFLDPVTFNDTESLPHEILDWMVNVDTYSKTILTNDTALMPFILLERYCIVSMYRQWNGPEWRFQRNFLTPTSVCDWNEQPEGELYGVICDSQGRVIQLSLSNHGLMGPIPEEVYHLVRLEWLKLPANNIQGSISTHIGNLERLIDVLIGPSQMTGTIPTEVGLLPDLEAFEVYDSFLNGTIPTEFGNNRKLEAIAMHKNALTGVLPVELATLSKLVVFALYSNRLTGTVPIEYRALSNLERFEIPENFITGSVDPIFCEDFSVIPNMQVLAMDCTGSTLDGSLLSYTVCSCCTVCCNPYAKECEWREPLVPKCEAGGCVACDVSVMELSCGECPYIDDDGSISYDLGSGAMNGWTQLCLGACNRNPRTGICELRTEFGL